MSTGGAVAVGVGATTLIGLVMWVLGRKPEPGRFREFSLEEAQRVADQIGIRRGAVDIDEFRRGLSIELEHGKHDLETNVSDDDLIITGKIAWAHLKELPDYYTRLARIEVS